MLRLSLCAGQVALVTGGGSGIGFEITRQLGLHGAAVVIMGRREGPLNAAVSSLGKEGVRCTGVQGDVRNEQDCARAVREAVCVCPRFQLTMQRHCQRARLRCR